MKLAVVSLVYKLTTLQSKGGAEVWVATFAMESARRNHHLDLYAVKGSLKTKNINLISSLNKPIARFYDNSHFLTEDPVTFGKQFDEFALMINSRILNMVRDREDQYDIIINGTASPIFAFNSGVLKKPVLTIGHDPPHFAFNFYAKVFGWPANNIVVFPSQHQYDCATSIPKSNRTVIPHGINLTPLHLNERGGDHMVWMSRIDYPFMDKGVADAIEVAHQLSKKLHVTGFVERGSRRYVENTIKSLVTPNVLFEEQNDQIPVDKNAIFGGAKLFLFPTNWEESFGIVMLEAMACGTPVVAYARGSVPEVVADGVTGFIVNHKEDDIRGDYIVKTTGREGLCEAVERIYSMNPDEYLQMRKNCRARVEQSFTVERMVDQYEQLYSRFK